jgi:hypothetical protein
MDPGFRRGDNRGSASMFDIQRTQRTILPPLDMGSILHFHPAPLLRTRATADRHPA